MAASQAHTFAPGRCRLASVSVPEPLAGFEEMPALRAQFFYSSPVPIDDPLSIVSVVGAADAKSAKRWHRPFSVGDNNALETAWLALASEDARRTHARARTKRKPSSGSMSRQSAAKLASIADDLAARHEERHRREGLPLDGAATPGNPALGGNATYCCPELPIEASAALRESFCELTRRWQAALDEEQLLKAVMDRLQTAKSKSESQAVAAMASGADEARPTTTAVTGDAESPRGRLAGEGKAIQVRPPAADDGISGKPFVRVEAADDSLSPLREGSRPPRANSTARAPPPPPQQQQQPPGTGQPEPSLARSRSRSRAVAEGPSAEKTVDVVVGISRLHVVSLPVLQMKPIYWSPIGDMATVLRATWFYKDTMTPVEAVVANQLEAGYRELKPFTETWGDELRCATEVGPPGEEKVSHRLWPEDDTSLRAKHAASEPVISSDPVCAARCFQGEAAAEGTLEPVRGPRAEQTSPSSAAASAPETRAYSGYDVIYRDGISAFLLKPSQRPSSYYGRRPVSKIMRGITVGIPVIRGFDRVAWEQMQSGKSTAPGTTHATASSAAASAPTGVVADADAEASGRDGGDGDAPCPGCRAEKDRGQVTDLVLVIHGIGQKFAERVESFHFTHAINAFRRAVNQELASDGVRSVLREGQNGIMVLPVNWRHALSFEHSGPMTDKDRAAASMATDDALFGLKDIEPDTIPAVRSLISDVMFDIPFYMSHHRQSMITALVGEANRVYRLWCGNNPGFAARGRVHLIGHSLGSAMALEVLSRQPTRLSPSSLLLSPPPPPQTGRFDFDTTNLFLLGSPAGFFLLLEHGQLLPRRGRVKPGADPADAVSPDLVGDAGTFGCLAVDNVYNVLAREDPIAYLLNGTIDPAYAASLAVAYLPSTATTFLQSVRNALLLGVSPAAAQPSAPPPRPLLQGQSSTASMTVPRPPNMRLPSQLEMEVHDFTREEMAEKKAFLLNDNGQIDYFLRATGGPLEIQYLNMLSAHSSYWTNQDLVRMLCVEVGRKPGRAHTLPSMRAVKSTRRLLLPSVKMAAS